MKVKSISFLISYPVPGNNTLVANLMARAWNSSSELQTVNTIGAARSVARKWAQNLLSGT